MPIEKDVLWIGRWKYPTGTFAVNRADIAQAVKNGNEMLKNGIAIKLIWEHQDWACPMPTTTWMSTIKNNSQWAKAVVCDAIGFRVGANDKGEPCVLVKFDDRNLSATDRQQIERCGKVSARVDENYRDPHWSGKTYPGLSIGHVALTPRPVHARQGTWLMGKVSKRFLYMGELAMAKESKTADNDTGDIQPMGEFAKMIGIIGKLGERYGFTVPETVTDLETLEVFVDTLVANGGDAGGMSAGDDQFKLDDDPVPDASNSQQPGGGGMPVLMSFMATQQSNPGAVRTEKARIAKAVNVAVRAGQMTRAIGQKMLDELNARTFQMSFMGTSTGVQPIREGLAGAADAFVKYVPKGTFTRSGTMEQHALQSRSKPGGNPPTKFAPQIDESGQQFNDLLNQRLKAERDKAEATATAK